MTDGILVQLRELATEVGATVPQVKYWCQLLGIIFIVRGRVAHLEIEAADKVREVGKLIAGGLSPRDAVSQVGASPTTPSTTAIAIRSSDDPMIADRLQQLERAVLAMAEKMTVLVEMNGKLTARLESSNKNSTMLAEPVKPVTPWQPVAKPDPMAGKPIWYRAWCEVFSPERMRRH